jgi:hypothetical protein
MARAVVLGVVLLAASALVGGCGGKTNKNLAACSAMQRAVDLSDRYVRSSAGERNKLRAKARKASQRLQQASREATAPNLAFHGQRLALLYIRQLDQQPVKQSDLVGASSVVNDECRRLGRKITSKISSQ